MSFKPAGTRDVLSTKTWLPINESTSRGTFEIVEFAKITEWSTSEFTTEQSSAIEL